MITGDMEIEDLVRDFPEAVGLLAKKGIICVQCGTPLWGTLDELARRKGVEDIDGLVVELNASVNKTSK